jgi:hypothetical protein
LGIDLNGYSYQRFFSSLFRPTTVALVLVQGSEDIAAGRQLRLPTESQTSALRQNSTSLQFRSRGLAAIVEPSEIVLSSAESANVQVSVSVPSGMQPFTGSDLTVTVESRSGPKVFNGTSHHFSISSESQ